MVVAAAFLLAAGLEAGPEHLVLWTLATAPGNTDGSPDGGLWALAGIREDFLAADELLMALGEAVHSSSPANGEMVCL